MLGIRRREFLTILGGAATWPMAALAQRTTAPVIAVINGGARPNSRILSAFTEAIAEQGYIVGQSVVVEYHFLDGRLEVLPALAAELVRRRVAVIAAPASISGASAAKVETSIIPIVFGVGEDPVALGFVESLAHPRGNMTGINFFSQETTPKRLGLLHELVPRARRVGVLNNPSNALVSEIAMREVRKSAGAIGLSIDILEASNSQEIEAAFATLVRERIEALFVVADAYFNSRTVQFATLANRHGIATSGSSREFADAGGLMSYGTDYVEVWRQVGSYAGQILKGARPADLPVVQSTKFEFVLNLQTARALGIAIPPGVLGIADDVID
jgi:putative ABC transport system substrate-binding protein